jgi:hypothetical protein
MEKSEFYQELPSSAGLPTLADLERWRAILTPKQGGPDIELVGVMQGADGALFGIWRSRGEHRHQGEAAGR